MICSNCKERKAKVWFIVLARHDWCMCCFVSLRPILGGHFEMLMKTAMPGPSMGKKEAKEFETMLLLNK